MNHHRDQMTLWNFQVSTWLRRGKAGLVLHPAGPALQHIRLGESRCPRRVLPGWLFAGSRSPRSLWSLTCSREESWLPGAGWDGQRSRFPAMTSSLAVGHGPPWMDSLSRRSERPAPGCLTEASLLLLATVLCDRAAPASQQGHNEVPSSSTDIQTCAHMQTFLCA